MGLYNSHSFKMNNQKVDFAIQHTGLRLINAENFYYFINKYGVWTGDVFPKNLMDSYGIKEWIVLAEDIAEQLKNNQSSGRNDFKTNKQQNKKIQPRDN